MQSLQEKNLIGKNVNYLKILARGNLDKPLIVEANEFSIDAIKMILLVGGTVIRIIYAKSQKALKKQQKTGIFACFLL